jgi:hypothetical protein
MARGAWGLAVVAVPVAVCGYFALVAFTGCFVGCSDPEPLVGVMYVATALVLLAIPVIAGRYTARASSAGGRRLPVWGIVGLAVLAALFTVQLVSRSF